MLKNKTILLGITGGIACYKVVQLASDMVKQHCDVHVVMTKNATEFIAPLTFETITGNRVIVDTFDRNHPHQIEHISLADMADLVLIAPATANIIAKLAHGFADDMLTTTVLACSCPKIIAPAMNTNMYENPITQCNMNTLTNYGWDIIEPTSGRLACGVVGTGKLADIDVILEAAIHKISYEKDLLGLKVLVTAGPTQESLDPVRYLTNHSSGRMGYALARAAAARGAQVTLVTGPTTIRKPLFVETVEACSAREMFVAVTERSKAQDIIIMAAAVADYRPLVTEAEKIKKTQKADDLNLPLARTDDILAWLGEHRTTNQTLCGFAMETQSLIAHARDKLIQKHVDMIAANNLRDPGAGFAYDTNRITLITREKEIALPLLSKDAVAHQILNEILLYRNVFVE